MVSNTRFSVWSTSSSLFRKCNWPERDEEAEEDEEERKEKKMKKKMKEEEKEEED